jgi:predicted nucleic acid-binding protein
MIIFDASTLILLAKTELLDAFLDSFDGEVLIPAEVQRECCAVKKSLDVFLIAKAINEKRIIVKVLKERQLCRKISADFSLGSGEAEAIALALSAKAQLVGIDDKNGINACKLLKLPFATAINILIRMREKGLIEKEAALMKLSQIEQYGRYKSNIIADARSRLEEGK